MDLHFKAGQSLEQNLFSKGQIETRVQILSNSLLHLGQTDKVTDRFYFNTDSKISKVQFSMALGQQLKLIAEKIECPTIAITIPLYFKMRESCKFC